MPSSFSVPSVDITAYTTSSSSAEREAIARRIDHACRTVGFMQITGHGISRSVTDELAAAVDGFFGLGLDEKKGYIRPSGENRGYSPPKSESLSYSLGVDPVTRMNDFFEAFNVGASAADYPQVALDPADYAMNVWPSSPDSFREQVEQYFREARRVAHALTAAFADALGVDRDYFTALSDHSLDVLRMNNYALPPGNIELGAELTGMGEHTDFGIVTVLWADQVEGLQVLDRDGGWHDVMPADGALLVNLGDVAARLTNDEWLSTLHRVKPPVVNGTIKRRRSVAFFHDGNADAVIATLPRFAEHGDQLYEPVTVKEHITAKLRGSRAGTKNPNATREAARVTAASQ